MKESENKTLDLYSKLACFPKCKGYTSIPKKEKCEQFKNGNSGNIIAIKK